MGKETEVQRLYLALVCTQALHSTEEIIFGFYRRTPEIGARVQTPIPCFPLVSFSATVFILVNFALVGLLALSVLLICRDTRWARGIITMVAIVEFFNGAAHMTMAAVSGGYFPGAVTAIGLFILSRLTLRATLRPTPTGIHHQ